MGADAAAGRHDGTPPGEDEIAARMRAGGLRPHGWGNGPGELLIRLDPLTAPRRTQALAALCDQLNQAQACYPGTDLVLRYEVKSHPGIA